MLYILLQDRATSVPDLHTSSIVHPVEIIQVHYHRLIDLIADVFKLFEDLPWRPLEVFGNVLLLLRRQLGVLLA
jgi:hypothetical protein